MSFIAPPVWLQEDAEIRALLHAIVDRFDRQRADARQRHVSVPAEKHLPTLARVDAQADQCWALVCQLEQLGVLSVRVARRNPLDPQWSGAKLAFPLESEPVLREWLRREWLEPASALWRQAVQAHAKSFPREGEALLARKVDIPARSAAEVVAAFSRIATVSGPITLRQLSAAVFWGDSKVLDDRGELITALFPDLVVLERPLVVSVFLPEACNGVLFIENQDTYTTGVRGIPAQCRGLALVYAAGFRSAAARVRSRNGSLLHYAGAGVAAGQEHFERWWYDSGSAPGPCWFWGDLDFAGMQILKSLRSRFATLSAWQPGYQPMLEALRRLGGYAQTVSGEDPAQADPGLTGCPYADDFLLPAIRECGHRDQESPPHGSAAGK
jgi:hypothetical protein